MCGSVIEQGSVCSVSGCSLVTVTHLAGGKMSVKTSPCNDDCQVAVTHISGGNALVNASLHKDCGMTARTEVLNKPIRVNVGLICSTSTGEWEYLMVDEGEIMLIDGERVMVKRKI